MLSPPHVVTHLPVNPPARGAMTQSCRGWAGQALFLEALGFAWRVGPVGSRMSAQTLGHLSI